MMGMRHFNPPHTSSRRRRRLVLCGALICAAARLPAGTALGAPSQITAVTENVNGHKVEYVLAGQGTPSVIFENGLGSTLDNWLPVLQAISQHTTVLAYNRPGYGDSEAATTLRDGRHIVDELRALLASAGLKPPYVLVGHSAGGLYMQYFARRYPRDVAGLVLVDSTHPQQFQGKGALDANIRPRRLVAAQAELELLNATGQFVLALPPLIGKPVLVLSARKPLKIRGDYADDTNEKRRKLVRLYPGAKQVWVDSGHRIQVEKPEAVIGAVQEILAEIKK